MRAKDPLPKFPSPAEDFSEEGVRLALSQAVLLYRCVHSLIRSGVMTHFEDCCRLDLRSTPRPGTPGTSACSVPRPAGPRPRGRSGRRGQGGGSGARERWTKGRGRGWQKGGEGEGGDRRLRLHQPQSFLLESPGRLYVRQVTVRGQRALAGRGDSRVGGTGRELRTGDPAPMQQAQAPLRARE
ncbi:hypothetical protein NN561_009039 [Cricetulus griseus]